MNYSPESVSRGGSIPEPFNENDVAIWIDLICKFVCQNMSTSFNIENFLDEIINDKIMQLNAYDKGTLKKTRQGDKNEFYDIIVYCLKFLQRNQLLASETYSPTERLKAICTTVNEILMPGIKFLLDRERAIRNDSNYPNIVGLLRNLEGCC